MFLDLLLNYYQVVYYCYQVYFRFLFLRTKHYGTVKSQRVLCEERLRTKCLSSSRATKRLLPKVQLIFNFLTQF